MKLLTFVLCSFAALLQIPANGAQAELKDLSIDGGLQDGKARLIIEAHLTGGAADKGKLLFSSSLEHLMRISREKLAHSMTLNIEVLQGDAKELPFTITGDGEIKSVTGEALQDWSIRQETNGTRTLVLRPRKGDKPITQLNVVITAERPLRTWTNPVQSLTIAPPQSALFSGYVKIEFSSELDVQPSDSSGVVPIEPRFLPATLRGEVKEDEPEPQAFRFHGAAYNIPLQIRFADPEARRVVLRNFKLVGDLSDSKAAFTLTATARVRNPEGASLSLLSGSVAFTDLPPHPDWRLKYEQGRYVLVFDRAGEFPLELHFNAAVRQSNDWNRVDFNVAPSSLQPVTFHGLAADTQFEFVGAARPDRAGDNFVSFLPPNGGVKLAWKEKRPEAEGKLFYSAGMLSQISISPGLMRQVSLLDFKVMQGELSRVVLLLRGQGNVTRVQGANVLAWNVEEAAGQPDRRLVVQLNQPQREQFSLQVQMQTELGSFPQAVDAIQLRPEGAIRFGGHLRVVNEGAVRLEVVQASGLSQISPEQFPESDATKAAFGAAGSQRFAFRFSSAEFALRVQADNILPEISVSEVLTYYLGETELAIEAEMELDIREAPIRELLLRVPRGYAIARLNAAGLSDYFTTDNAEELDAQLRLVYGQPVSGRHVVQLRLERNAALTESAWNLPRVEVARAKSTRGHIAVGADAGFRLSPERTQGLTEIATAFFPKKLPGIQAAFRLSEPAWQASMRVERLPQSIQADVFHLFSIGEGIGYGSSTINYLISGAPISTFNIELSNEYFNVEFTGKDLRNWQKTATGYTVQLHTPVSGTYTLLATYERPFKAQGDTLAFTGARPLDAQSEQGHTVIISAYQFQVKPVDVSSSLLPLETAEVPAEYRLLFDAPILAAYRYTSRPFNLQLGLSPLAQGETVSLVVDRAALTTRISKEGEVLTDARYFVKNRGNPHFRITLPAATALWSATVNGITVVPVKDGAANLIPLPQSADPNAIQVIDLKLASRSTTSKRVRIAVPVVTAPVLLAEWNVQPDTGQRLVYRRGSLMPATGIPDISGFAGLARIFSPPLVRQTGPQLFAALGLLVLSAWAWRWASSNGAYRYSPRHVVGTFVGSVAIAIAVVTLFMLGDLAAQQTRGIEIPRALSFLAPVQQSPDTAALAVEVANIKDEPSAWSLVWHAWPVLPAVALFLIGFKVLTFPRFNVSKPAAIITGWTLLAWAALRWPHGAPVFFVVVIAFLLIYVAAPALRRLWLVPGREPLPAQGGPAPATVALLVGGLFALSVASTEAAARVPARSTTNVLAKESAIAESVVQEIRVHDDFAFATATLRWQATEGQFLPILFEPAVLTGIEYPTNTLKLIQGPVAGKRGWQLLAQQSGAFDIKLQFQVHTSRKDTENGFYLPTQQGLVNRLTLTLTDLDMEVVAPQAVSVERESVGSNTVARLVLAPAADAWIAWKPRHRDVKSEKPLFYAELFQLYVPSAGVIEGVHQVHIRPAQGELGELIFEIPAGATITDVLDQGSTNGLVTAWRFDPDTRKLRVSFSSPQSRPFTLLLRSQVAAGPLPFEQTLGLVKVENAAGQLGLLGIATGSEVQLDNVTAEAFSPINLEDFPAGTLQTLSNQVAGLTLRRAFRYTDIEATAVLTAAAVEPDVRVDTQQTLSLGEDRIVLAANLVVTITRAGIFRLSFVLPAGLDVESISGQALSHWTELKTDEGRIITLHLKGKTEGQQQFALSLVGQGLKTAQGWSVPRLILREASKHSGQLVIVPEQGLRLQVNSRDGLTQLDPQKAGIRQKGVLAFRLLQSQWQLTLDIEQVDPWVQVTSLQHVSVSEAQVKVAANFQYQIENTGLKALRVRIPTNAESVRFWGEHVADFLPIQGAVQDGLQTWEVKLHRRVIGKHLLQMTYLMPLTEQATSYVISGAQTIDANLQRGFLTVQSAGRLQVRIDAVPPALQPSEWQSIPRALQQDISATSADRTFRVISAAYQLPILLTRQEAAKLLPARVNNLTLNSVISDQGVMLTEVRMELVPGDKRLLQLTLPPNAQFWFAFVNQNGVWPWRDQDRVLIPLEQQSRVDKPLLVEVFYSSRIGAPGTVAMRKHLDLQLLGPKFDLPLENITWHVYLDEKWHLADWSGSLQLQEDKAIRPATVVELQTYLQKEANLKREKTRQAEELLSMGNTLLERGNPHQARRAFQAAYGLSTHDDAFNEDARVQLHNLKLQQALVGLNVRQAVVAGETEAAKLRDLRARKDIAYTQQEAKQILDASTADENAALLRLAERLIQQQDAAISSPAAIRASIPQQGRLLTFRRTVQVDTWADLKIGIEATARQAASLLVRFAIVAAVFALFAALIWMSRQLISVSPQSLIGRN